jgi:hypothetical protein
LVGHFQTYKVEQPVYKQTTITNAHVSLRGYGSDEIHDLIELPELPSRLFNLRNNEMNKNNAQSVQPKPQAPRTIHPCHPLSLNGATLHCPAPPSRQVQVLLKPVSWLWPGGNRNVNELSDVLDGANFELLRRCE